MGVDNGRCIRGPRLRSPAALVPRRKSKLSCSSLSKSILRAARGFDPTRGVSLGLHEYDGRLHVLAKASVERRVAIRGQVHALDAFAKTDGQSARTRLEPGVLRSLVLIRALDCGPGGATMPPRSGTPLAQP